MIATVALLRLITLKHVHWRKSAGKIRIDRSFSLLITCERKTPEFNRSPREESRVKINSHRVYTYIDFDGEKDCRLCAHGREKNAGQRQVLKDK